MGLTLVSTDVDLYGSGRARLQPRTALNISGCTAGSEFGNDIRPSGLLRRRRLPVRGPGEPRLALPPPVQSDPGPRPARGYALRL
jgi:hypothetical protein